MNAKREDIPFVDVQTDHEFGQVLGLRGATEIYLEVVWKLFAKEKIIVVKFLKKSFKTYVGCNEYSL